MEYTQYTENLFNEESSLLKGKVALANAEGNLYDNHDEVKLENGFKIPKLKAPGII